MPPPQPPPPIDLPPTLLPGVGPVGMLNAAPGGPMQTSKVSGREGIEGGRGGEREEGMGQGGKEGGD